MIQIITYKAANCYLLTSNDGSILIDTCGQSAASHVYEKIKDRNVRLILLTHGHPDHTGAAAVLSDRLSVPVAMSKEDTELLENPNARTLHAHMLTGRILKLATRMIIGGQSNVALLPVIWLKDRQSLTEYGMDAKVIALPGHTRGSVGVLTASGDLIAGDAVFNLLNPSGSLIYENREQMNKSLGFIAQSRAKTLYPGHGSPVHMEKFILSGDSRFCENLKFFKKRGLNDE